MNRNNTLSIYKNTKKFEENKTESDSNEAKQNTNEWIDIGSRTKNLFIFWKYRVMDLIPVSGFVKVL